MSKHDGEKPSPEMPAGEYVVRLPGEAYDPESDLFQWMDSAEANPATVFYKMGRIVHAIDAAIDADDGTTTITMHQADAAYVWLAFKRVIANWENAAELAPGILGLPVDQAGRDGNKAAKFLRDITMAGDMRRDVKRIEAELREQGESNPREQAIEQVAEQFHKDARTVRKYLAMLNPDNKADLMAKYKIISTEKP